MQNEQDRHLFMRCNAIDISAFGELPEGYHLRTCRPEELDIWYGFPFDTPEDAEKIRAKLLEQSKGGLILLPAGLHYAGTVGANPEIRVLYDNDREDGYWEDNE